MSALIIIQFISGAGSKSMHANRILKHNTMVSMPVSTIIIHIMKANKLLQALEKGFGPLVLLFIQCFIQLQLT